MPYAEAFASPVTQPSTAEPGVFEAVASSFASIAEGQRGPTEFARSAFDRSIKVRPVVPCLWAHDDAQPIGTAALRVDPAVGLLARCRLVLASRRAAEAYALLKAGAVRAVSIGFTPVKIRSSTMRDGRPGRLVEDADVMEVSIVVFGADPSAKVLWTHSAAGHLVRDPRERMALALEQAALRYPRNPGAAEYEASRLLGVWGSRQW